MSEIRKPRPVSREVETRETLERPKVWQPPKKLPNFNDADPEYHYRWVRYELRGAAESANVLQRVREGYEPVRPEDVGLVNHPTLEDGRFEGTVISGDLMLMKIPQHMADQRATYFSDLTARQQGDLDQELKGEDNELMPLSRVHKTGTSTGTKPHFRAETDE